MALKYIFGVSAWGAFFVAAMNRLADSGRLERGRSYAGSGKVVRLDIDGGCVTAKVRGSYQPYYKVRIQFSPLPALRLAELRALIEADPLLPSQLANGDMPDSFLKKLQQQKINLLPTRWSDMKRSCDCPDNGDPCKHQAAVYYLIAREIDRDPLLLFRLRGLALQAPVSGDTAPTVVQASAKTVAKTAAKAPVKASAKRQAVAGTSDPKPAVAALPAGPPLTLVPPWPEPTAQAAGGSALPFYGTFLPAILPPSRGIAEFDLRLQLAAFYHRVAGRAALCLGDDPTSVDPSGQPGRQAEPASALERRWLELRGALRLWPDGRCRIQPPDGRELSPLQAWLAFPRDCPAGGGAEYRFLRQLFWLLDRLARAAAFVPVVYLSEGHFRVGWRPARFCSEVERQLRALEPLVPVPVYAGKEKTRRVPDAASCLELLACAFLEEFVLALNFKPTRLAEANHPAMRALFGGQRVDCRRPGETSLPLALANWLAMYQGLEQAGRFELQLDLLAASTKAARQAAPRQPDEEAVVETDAAVLNCRLKAAWLDERQERKPLHQIAKSKNNQAALNFAALLANYLPALTKLAQSASCRLPEAEASAFILETAPLLSHLGVSVVLPRQLRSLTKLRPVLVAGDRPAAAKRFGNFIDAAAALNFNWQIALGDQTISPADFETLLKSGQRLVRFRDQWLRLDPAEAAALLAALRRASKPQLGDTLREIAAGRVALTPAQAKLFGFLRQSLAADLTGAVSADGRPRRAGKKSAAPETIRPLPDGLLAELRPYQRRGFDWLASMAERGLGVILADDMGLGKTVQAIALLLERKAAGQLADGCLICAPASLLTNWSRELARFAPSLSVRLQYGSGRRQTTALADVTLTSYQTWLRDAAASATSATRRWSLVILDEAHYIKNHQTRRAQTIKRLDSQMRLALTGTPVENNLAELWSLFDFVLPGYLESLPRFTSTYREPIERYQDQAKAAELRRVTQPFLLRRMKTDLAIAPDLPDKVVIDEYAQLVPTQAALYQSICQSSLRKLNQAGDTQRLGLVLAMLTALKQVGNHPRNYDKQSPADVAASGKAALLMELLDSAVSSGERVLVFSQYVEMLNILATLVWRELGLEPFLLHGGLSRLQRDTAVDGFQSGQGSAVFLISLKAGGVGLNLTAASRVIHYDLWFNPAVENQATDRAFRIGQRRNVFVHRLITRGTLEEKIDAIIKAKVELADLTVRSGEHWLTKLDNAELAELVRLE
ncbi:MAG: hypothetical protein A2087_03335 [Spirochaetes bacterium GWD1_61_31]|nr:MAG: hypothetical protein A2Y37_05435 [Spirochaetes bacterium GWB1_60_80]OHD38617.1 MAG: hypothetical protein A2087_03335 [Spirochaetes bacterium GWD1_61_31]OHD43165.1 MAG: hypothetical protein A2Y35_01240 [Spirochaetes bacterium GWE1_60_18]OHD58740.1 MAG: hypothetical protein A2Y32_01725 [Spirochaetes bacterium GWF1_60_12]